MPAMPAPSTGFPQPPAQSCSLALSVCPQSLPIASSRLLGALFQFSNFRHKPFFPASLLLLQLVTPCVWGGRAGGAVQIHLKCPLLLARPLPCLSSLSVWFVAPRGFPKSEELHVGPHYPAPLGSMGPKYGCVGIISAGPGSGHQAIGMGQAPLCCALGLV